MPKLFKHTKTGVMVWAVSDDFGPCWKQVSGCWLDKLSRPFKDSEEERLWLEDSIMLHGQRIGPLI